MIDLRDVEKAFTTRGHRGPQRNAVDGLSLQIPDGSLVTLLGPSGCGKTTTLRMIAGLERPDRGTILIDDKVVFSHEDRVFVSANRRPLGMVFQSYAIWPHMTVLENVVFPLAVRRGMSRAAARGRARDVLELLGLSEYADRPAPDLSGGQQQRVALARALVREPRVLLLDEPLSNLDAGLRDQMGTEVRALQSRLGVTTVFVTHDQGEALAMSDLVVVMNEGRVVEQGTPEEIYRRPKSEFTAQFMGIANVLVGTVSRVAGPRVEVAVGPGTVVGEAPGSVAEGDLVRVFVHPEGLRMSDSSTHVGGAWTGEVERCTYRGEHSDYLVRVGTDLLKIRQYGARESAVVRGDTVCVEPDGCVALVTKVSEAGTGDGSE